MAELEKTFKNIVKKGKVVFGQRQVKKSIEEGKSKLVVIAKNCPFLGEMKSYADTKNAQIYETTASSVDLGALCGKTFAVSVFSIIDDGEANVLHLLKKG